jgi:trehalose 6-phosphate phosphatase
MSYPEQPFDALKADPVSGQESIPAMLSLHPHEFALFLDIDGTLLDLAETPDGIVVPPDLPARLDALSEKLGGALALVTGRGLAHADTLFAPFRFPVAGLHGAERRDPDGAVKRAESTPQFERLKRELTAFTADWAGVVIEDKGAAVAAHYRLAPAYREELEPVMARCLAEAGPGWVLQRGKMVIELRPANADKGHAVEAFLGLEPFRGRQPVAIGDDVTDEAMFRTVNALGGYSIRVGAPTTETAALGLLPSAESVREMIARIAA